MKIRGIIYALCLLCVFGNKPVLADGDYRFGIIDAVYSKSSQLIIDDMSYYYTRKSSFYKDSGSRILSVNVALKVGTPVKFSFSKESSGLRIKELQIISKREFKRLQKSVLRLF